MQQIPSFPVFTDPGSCPWELKDALHVWRFPAGPVAPSLLTDAEKQFADRFHRPEDRNRFVSSRQALRLLLSKYLSKTGEIELSLTGAGKLFLPGALSPVFFNLSHSGRWILLAFAKDELGVDIEQVHPQFEFQDLLAAHFNAQEASFVRASPDPAGAFYYLWTRKEALTKAWGTGLQENLQEVAALEDGPHPKNHKAWTLSSFYVSTDYPAAVACAAMPAHILYFEGGSLL